MSAVAFGYVLLLRGAEAQDKLALLSEERRADVQAVLEKAKDLPPEQIRTQLKELRHEELDRQREYAKNRIGRHIDRVSPRLHAWLTQPF